VRVHTTGLRERTPLLDVRRAASMLPYPRVAIVVPKFGQTAVARNRIKRRLRELVRRELLPGLAAADVVVRAVPSSYRATFVELEAAMRSVAARLTGQATAAP